MATQWSSNAIGNYSKNYSGGFVLRDSGTSRRSSFLYCRPFFVACAGILWNRCSPCCCRKWLSATRIEINRASRSRATCFSFIRTIVELNGARCEKCNSVHRFRTDHYLKTELVPFRTRFAFLLSRYSFVLVHDRSPSTSAVSQSICSLQTKSQSPFQIICEREYRSISFRLRGYSAKHRCRVFPNRKETTIGRLYYHRPISFPRVISTHQFPEQVRPRIEANLEFTRSGGTASQNLANLKRDR